MEHRALHTCAPRVRRIPQDTAFYFVHSYYPAPADTALVAGVTEYGGPFASCIARDNLIAFQFHLEKSGRSAEAPGQFPLLGREEWSAAPTQAAPMLEKRVIVCLDVKDGRTTKGIKFKDNVDVGDPVEMAHAYYEEGVDELVFYDITASAERRGSASTRCAGSPSRSSFPFPWAAASPRWRRCGRFSSQARRR